MTPTTPPIITPEAIAAISGVVLSLLMSYVPGLSTSYERLAPTPKRLIMASLLLAATLGTVFWTCWGGSAGTSCAGGADWWKSIIMSYIAALTANQATHRITPQPSDNGSSTSTTSATGASKW